jgi:hypothetical protein
MTKDDKRRAGAIRKAKHDRRDAARKERQAEKKKQQGFAPAHVEFTIPFGCDTLESCGPQFFCLWGVADVDAEALRNAGRPVPDPIAGALLLDTGATRTCIALQAAQQLGLQARRMQEGFGANGKYVNQVFLARLEIRIMDPNTKVVHPFSWEQEVEGIPELHNLAAPLRLNGQTLPVSGLLGRDILKHAKIRYDGPAGKLHFQFDVASIRRQPSR